MISTGDFVQVEYTHMGECVGFLTYSWRNIPVSFLFPKNRMVLHSTREHWRKRLNFEDLQNSREKRTCLKAIAINHF